MSKIYFDVRWCVCSLVRSLHIHRREDDTTKWRCGLLPNYFWHFLFVMLLMRFTWQINSPTKRGIRALRSSLNALNDHYSFFPMLFMQQILNYPTPLCYCKEWKKITITSFIFRLRSSNSRPLAPILPFTWEIFSCNTKCVESALQNCTRQSKFIFWAITQNYDVFNASTQKAVREALRSLNWPSKQTKEQKYEYFRRDRMRNITRTYIAVLITVRNKAIVDIRLRTQTSIILSGSVLP